MGKVTYINRANFSIGDLIYHRMFKYRGVIIDVDPTFQLTDEWYEAVARSRPPKDKPWYHVLVHEASHATYVAERNLKSDESMDPIVHPLVTQFFTKFENGRYIRESSSN